MTFTIDGMGIDVPPPFDTIENDILGIFTDFKSDILSKLLDVYNDIRTTADNGIDNVLTLMVVPNSMVQIVTKPFNDFIAILNSYSVEWNNVGSSIANIVYQFVSMMYIFRATIILTPIMLSTIMKTSIDLTMATIVRTVDPRIFRNIQGAYVGNIYRFFDTIQTSMSNGIAFQTSMIQSYRDASFKQFDTFSDTIATKLVFVGAVYLLFIYSISYFIDKRYR